MRENEWKGDLQDWIFPRVVAGIRQYLETNPAVLGAILEKLEAAHGDAEKTLDAYWSARAGIPAHILLNVSVTTYLHAFEDALDEMGLRT